MDKFDLVTGGVWMWAIEISNLNPLVSSNLHPDCVHLSGFLELDGIFDVNQNPYTFYFHVCSYGHINSDVRCLVLLF